MLAPEAEFLFNPNWPAGTPPATQVNVTHQQLRIWSQKGSVWLLFIMILWKVAEISRFFT